MKKLKRSNIYFLIILLGAMFLPYLLALVYYLLGVRDSRVMLSVNHIVLFLVPAVIYFVVTKSNVKETLRLNKITLKQVALIILTAIVTYPLMSCCAVISSLFVNNNVADYVGSISSTPYLIMILLFGVMPAITEEVTLRGIVLSGYRSQTKFKAALFNGLLFGIFHLDFHQFLYASVLGFIMAYVALITDSLFSSMLMHFTINSISVTMQKIATIGSSITTDVNNESIGVIQTSVGMKIMTILFMLFVMFLLSKVVKRVIKALEKASVTDEYYYDEDDEDDEEFDGLEKDKLINGPFIAIILVYLLYMFFLLP